VVAGADLQHCSRRRAIELQMARAGPQRISLRIHHNGESIPGNRTPPLSAITFECSRLLCPGLFPGVTPYRRDGESLFVALTCTFRLPEVVWIKDTSDRCGACAIHRASFISACLFTTLGSVVFLEFSHHQEI